MVNAISLGPKLRPGFDPAGQPLADNAVWGLEIGRAKRPVDTADISSGQKIDGWERRALLELATKKPQEFLQRLLADSANGTPVDYRFTKQLGIGVVRVDFHAEEGKIKTTASIEVFNKSADRALKPYLAKDARDKGARAKITLEVSGSLTPDGGVDDLKIEGRASNVPKFSAKKLLELHNLEKDVKKAIAGEGSAKAKGEEVMGIVERAIETVSDFPLPFLLNLIGDDSVIKAEIKEKGRDARANVELGKGKYSLLLRDISGQPKKGEPDVRVRLAGRGAEDKDTISVDELRVFTNDKLSVRWSEEGQPELFRAGKNGELSPVNDHIGELMIYLPMAMALAGDKIF